MAKGTILVVHPDQRQLVRLAEILKPSGHTVSCFRDLRGVVDSFEQVRPSLVITSQIRIPFERPHVVTNVQRASLRTPVILLEGPSPPTVDVSPTRILMGPLESLRWPTRARNLLQAVCRATSPASAVAPVSAPLVHDQDWLTEVRADGVEEVRRDVLAAMNATHGNISRAAELLGISRGCLQYRLHKYFNLRNDCTHEQQCRTSQEREPDSQHRGRPKRDR